MSAAALEALLAQARACTHCADLPLGPRPVLRARVSARLLIIGQAPGTRVHASGVPWDDRSGDRLRQWLDLDRDTFYDESRIAIIPTGLCYPGTAPRGGDLPPRPDCAPLWHPRLLAALPHIVLTLLVGSHAQAFHLKERRAATLTDTVRAWREYGPGLLPLPHPSWRTGHWEKQNPWFAAELLPEARQRVRAALSS
ncbi:uracil DNA glycosylase superfamily protein [mine drainage metagenome]|uniref:Uracil DNA glycosylase superfamily protein n=1 Tax=mine drainage metagenome TaxID=410659 RepID=A0A1J5SYU4_9ZZZZ